ncbi:MAG: hypothetical protein WDZ69_01175 [Candidatus Pacearchaeota archaeon]
MSSDDVKIRAVMILDIIGRPANHLIETLENMINDLGNEKKVDVLSKDIKEPVLMKDQKELYTTFAEVEIEVEEIPYLSKLMFKYMPANIEIISPEILMVSNDRINEILNDLIFKLHRYDEIARVMQVEKQILFRKIKELGGEIPKEVSPVAQIQQPGQEQQEQNKIQEIQKSPEKKNKEKSKKKTAKKKSSKK